jgi:hypothetical protein
MICLPTSATTLLRASHVPKVGQQIEKVGDSIQDAAKGDRK